MGWGGWAATRSLRSARGAAHSKRRQCSFGTGGDSQALQTDAFNGREEGSCWSRIESAAGLETWAVGSEDVPMRQF